MKNIILMLLCVVAFTGAKAQQKFTPLLDTNTNTESRSIVANVLAAKGTGYSLQYTGTKVSGTVSGKVYLEGSVDGTNYGSAIDSLTLADQAVNTKIFDVTSKRRYKYRFRVVTSGTMKIANVGTWVPISE
nr:MAG TPA: hypothetical protein [Caudoviricetes sp.]